MSGYHVEWNNSKQNSNKQQLADDSNEQQTRESQVEIVGESKIILNTVDEPSTSSDDKVTVSVNEQQVVAPKKKRNNLFSSRKVKTADREKQIKPFFRSKLKRQNQSTLGDEEEQLKWSGMAIAGFVCGLVGLGLFLGTGWPFLLGTLGLVFSAIGLGQTGEDRKKGKGLAIAGLITSIIAIIGFWILVATIAAQSG